MALTAPRTVLSEAVWPAEMPAAGHGGRSCSFWVS